MGTPRFRPKLERIEDRLTPAATQAQAEAALSFISASQQELQVVFEHLDDPKTARTLAYHQVYLPNVSVVNLSMAQTLAEHTSQVSAAVAADPSLAATFAPYIDGMNAARQTALANSAYALAWGIGLGAPPPAVPAPPPVSPPPPTSPLAPLNPTDASGVSRTIPDLNDSNWRTTDSGLRIWDVIEGEGAPVPEGGIATVHYIGWLTDGTVFDSSIDSGDRPFNANLNGGVIEGWIEGIPGLRPGGLRRLDIPPELAYGSQTRPGIPANSRLIFEIKGLTPGTTTQVP